MIQFNLLPDVKIEYVRAKRIQRMVIGTSAILTVAAVGVTLLLASVVYGIQKKNLADMDDDIKSYTAQLQSTPDLDKIITIQNQLKAINGLHDQKVAASRIFQVATQVTPTGVTISDLTADFANNTFTITGGAPALDRVNAFTDSLKYAKFTSEELQSTKPFTDVVLTQFARNDAAATYSISCNFDPALFDGATPYSLTVPNQISTGSVTGQPQEIFKKATTSSGTGQ